MPKKLDPEERVRNTLLRQVDELVTLYGSGIDAIREGDFDVAADKFNESQAIRGRIKKSVVFLNEMR